MKRFLGGLIAFLFSIGIASADGGVIKNFQAYRIIGHNIREVVPVVQETISSIGDKNTHKINSVSNAWYYTNAAEETYYMRFYPANKNTDVYVVANENYNKTNNELTEFCKRNNFQIVELDDRNALREYKFDFYDLARKDQLGGFFISPDCLKPLKTGMSKINNKLSKNSKKNAAIPYSEDVDPIDLDLIDHEVYTDSNAEITITVNEYRLKQKENKYVHAFEYLVQNTGSTPVIAKEVTCERLASTKDIATETFVDLDRLDLLDTVGTFPPVLIMTAGTSVLCAVPKWVRLARTTAEATRFAKSLPSNYTINSGKTMRILCLKYKANKKPLNFTFDREGSVYSLSF